jgi:hypothetical protein
VKKRKFVVGITACMLSLSGGVATAAPKPPKMCKLSDARPANRFGSVLVPSVPSSSTVTTAAPISTQSEVPSSSQAPASDKAKSQGSPPLVEPDDEILSSTIPSDKNRNISRRKINRTNESC